jgi:hypothetical protein
MFVQCNVYCVQCTPFPPVAEICARLAVVWFGSLSAISQLASRGEGWGVGQLSASIALHSRTLPAPGGESREGGCVPSPWFLPPLVVHGGTHHTLACGRGGGGPISDEETDTVVL